MQVIDLDKKPVFVLTYNEQDLWCANYPVIDFFAEFSEYQFIIIDNGKQQKIKEWCKYTNSYYFATEQNIGSTGGYNWIFKVANLLGYERAVLTQADVELYNTDTLDVLFQSKWDKNTIPFFPQVDKTLWDQTGQVYNLGQLFSFNASFLLENSFLNDENYVVTHYDDADLLRRMRDWGVKLKNILFENYPDKDCVDVDGSHVVDGLYAMHHYSSLKQERSTNHEEWLNYNADYHDTKWGGDGMPNEYPFEDWTKQDLGNFDSIIGDTYTEQMKFNVNKTLPHSSRWTDLGYLPYPVEHEINRFWTQYLKDLGINRNIT